MRGKQGVLLATLGVLASMGLLAPARAAERAVRNELAARYEQLVEAMKAADSTAVQQFLEQGTTSNFVAKSQRQTQTRRQMLTRLKQEPWEPSRLVRFTIGELVVEGDDAFVLVSGRVAGTHSNPKMTGDATGKPHEFMTTGTYRDTWTRSADGWKLKRRETLRAETTIDGRPFLPRGR
jgi:hypothetical protein